MAPPNTTLPDEVHQRDDRRLDDLVEAHFDFATPDKATTAFMSDPKRSASYGLGLNQNLNKSGLFTGMIVYALPFAHWYRVQLSGNGGVVGCSMLSHSNLTPLGAKDTSTLSTFSRVIVWMVPGTKDGIILGSYPSRNYSAELLLPDWLVQGGGCGEKRSPVYSDMFKRFYKNAGTVSYNSNRPHDATALDFGKITETGLALHLDPFLAFMRVNEVCGLWMSYFDDYMRIGARNADIQYSSIDTVVRDDEGELQLTVSNYTYPWEGLGLYAPGSGEDDDTVVGVDFEAEDVQYTKHKAMVDLPDGDEDTQAIARWQEFGGYLGQGHLRQLLVPADITGKRKMSDDAKATPDMGVFVESVGLDGSIVIASAHSISLTKRILMPVAKQIVAPEDQAAGDDSRRENYKASGQFGTGDEHKVGDLDVSAGAENSHLLTVAGISEWMAYQLNWKRGHPFHYHKEDYKLPEESDLKNFKRGPLTAVQEKLNFNQLISGQSMAPPTPKSIKVDDRYGNVDYFQREAGIALLPDGGICIYDGYGAQIVLSGGNIRFDCPGDVQIMPGRHVIAFGGRDIVLRAKNSVDVTAGEGNVTVKAERNLMMLGGNTEGGGVVIESKAKGFVADFEGKSGEEVNAGGIMLKAGQSSVVTWAKDIYLRTGSEDGTLGKGTITLDASQGKSAVAIKAKALTAHVADAVSFWLGPSGENSDVSATYLFGKQACLLAKDTLIGGSVIATSNFIADGFVFTRKAHVTIEGPPIVIKAKAGNFAQSIAEVKEALQQSEDAGVQFHNALFRDGLYSETQPGNATVIEQAAFSLRDDAEGSQYLASAFKLTECRWQMLARLGGCEGGVVWTEKPVEYHGDKQFPYPGKTAWEETPMLQIKSMTLVQTGEDGLLAQDRGEIYETPKLNGWGEETPATGYKTLL